jgi:hypothetical protein
MHTRPLIINLRNPQQIRLRCFPNDTVLFQPLLRPCDNDVGVRLKTTSSLNS